MQLKVQKIQTSVSSMKATSDIGQDQPAKASKPLIKSIKKNPSQLMKEQTQGKNIVEQFPKPKIIQFLNIGDNSIHIDSQVNVDEPLFAPEPHVIQFTNYEPLQTREQILKLRNKDRVARSIKIIPPDSKLFTVTPAKKSAMTTTKSKTLSSKNPSEDIDMLSSKVAPGMEITYIVKFFPEAKSDYSYDLMVITEREKFIVPIRAMGCRAILDFPDQLDFGLVPVKYDNEKPVILRNIGEKTTKWQIRTPASFQVSKSEGILEVGQVEQLIFHFKPAQARKYQEELVLCYDSFEATIPTLGEAHNDNVYLSKTQITADPTSITLFSHQYYKIVNKSSVPIEFSWRAFATDLEEQEKKDRLNSQLSLEEGDELNEIEAQFASGKIDADDDDGSLDSDDSYDTTELAAKQERRRQKAISALQRKYQAIKKAVTDDKMLFQDEIFQIEPLEGKIWPNTEMTCCVTFRPQGPYQYSCTAFCNTTCSQDRLALNLSGEGKGPQAQLSITEMDIGDIFVTSQKSFEIGIENTGEIDCHWKLIPYETPFGSKFKFSKSEGTLGVKEKTRDLISVTFLSDILGEFSETFRFALEGSSKMLTLTFKGHVVAPTFRFSDEIIDFGRISYKFPVYKTVFLTNTSEVDINYSIRVPGDGRSLQQEFKFSKDKGRLERDKTAEIQIEFIPCFPQIYDMVLVVDLEGVGQDMLAVPIKAECLVPKVRVTPVDFLMFDKCFLRFKKTMSIEIINEDDLKAKFEITQQDEQSKRIGVYEASIWSGVIEPRQKQVVDITLRTEILNQVRIALQIKLEGHHIPVILNLMADSVGPIVVVDREEIDYGNVEVLRDYNEKIRITNKSKIDAEYTAFTKSKESIWKIVQRHGILKPDEEKVVDVVCNADEVQKFQDKLHIIINNGVDLEVNLAAKGIGSTLYCKQDLRNIDFGTEYTHKVVPKQFFLENRGRKPMKISWVRQVKPQKKDNKEKAEAVAAKKQNQTATSGLGATSEKKDDEEETKFIFTVVPDTVLLNPKMGIMIEFRANSTQIGKMTEPWQCQAIIGNDRKPKPVFNSNVFGNFITPILQFNVPKLDFKYLWEKGVPSMPITKELAIKNMGPLATTINLKIDQPFSCPVEKLTLEKDASDVIKIDFDPGMKQDRLSDHINGKLTISHDGHPHKDIVQLQGEVCFPNLQILPPKIDFGCILNDTSKKKYLVLSNVSEMPVAYEWSFLEDAPIVDEMDEIEEGQKKKKKSKKNKRLPINEVFDILPVSGLLLPGQTENVEFTFYAGNGISYNGTAVCSCDGGPDYEVPIQGDSNLVTYRLSTKELDFGEVPYNESSTREFVIENIGKVPFEFNINLSTVSRPGLLECSTMVGKVLAGEKFKITVRFFAGIPDNIREMFLVECSHFPAERVAVRAVGIYPGCLLSFPRADDEQFAQRFDQVRQQLEQNKVDYSAKFHGVDALKLMPPIPAKFVDKEKVAIKEKETFVMEVEAECDRQLLCQKIKELVDMTVQNNLNQSAQSVEQIEPEVIDTKKTKKTEAKTGEKGRKAAMDKTITNDLNTSIVGFIKVGNTNVSLENISISTYCCDFGNVVVGGSKKKSFRLTNVGKIPINFLFDKKLLGQAGIAIDQDKGQKIMPNTSQLFTVVFTSRKNSKFGRQKYSIPIEIKNGPTYIIDFVANLTIPELNMSTDNLDFDRVCINTRKTVKLRIENNKEVPCEWWFHVPQPTAGAAPPNGDKKKDVEFFQVFPLSGTLLPGQRSTIDVMFVPNSDKPFAEKLQFKCRENPKQFILNVKGQGINNMIELVPETIKLGPVLPYDTKSIEAFEITNTMDSAIEIYSLDFDTQYLEEEEIIKRIENFTPTGSNEPIFLPYRKAGSEFWPSIKKADEIKTKSEALKAQIKKIEDQLQTLVSDEVAWVEYNKAQSSVEGGAVSELKAPERTQQQISEQRNQLTSQKGDLESKLLELTQEGMEVKLAPALKEENKLNVILIGPNSVGRTTVANYMAQEHQRCVIRLDQLYDYWQKRNHVIAEEASQYLALRDEELKKKIAEQEAAKKNKKPKKGEVEVEINPNEYKLMSRDILVRMVKLRLEEEDCNAGAIFDNLTSELWPDEKFAIGFISDAIPNQSIQVLIFNFNKEVFPVPGKDEGEEVEVCTNYRYAIRHDPALSGKARAQKKEEEKTGTEATPRDAKKAPKAPKVAPAKKDKKSDDKAGENVKRSETKTAKVVTDPRESYRPKAFTKEEKDNWKAYAKQVTDFYGELVMKQINANESEKNPGAGGKRILQEVNIEYDFTYLCEYICKSVVPEPLWPDPDKEPLPPPLINSVLKKPPNRNERTKITKFKILTPVGEIAEGDKFPQFSEKETRWVIQPKESKKLYIKFFSTKIGTYPENLQFEVVGSYKTFTLPIQGLCEFPSINQNVKNLYMSIKKTRPVEKDQIVIKSYIQSEGVFEFGPLLIKKDAEKRADPKIQEVNSTIFQITNNGKYKVDATFTLRSTLSLEEGGSEGKSPFIIEPSECSLNMDETLQLRVYAFPEIAQLYTDQLVVLIKDNPNPVILPIQCLGAKPVVSVSNDTVLFERALLNKVLTKTLTLTNTCPIKINWRLKKVDGLPAEFSVTPTSGQLLPFKEQGIDITFKSITQKKFMETIILEVEDVEGLGVKQDDKNIVLDAEAFNITLNEAMQIDQVLDFDAVRVGEPKEQTLFLKNQGQYPIKYDFTIRKKAQEIFTIEPMVGRLLKDEEINIVVRFLTMKETKIKTNKSTAEIFLNILEGDQNVKHQQIPILVNVNAVYSKYSLAPLKNLNFGPMQYGENVTRSFEIRNEGLFEFKYAICDYNNEDEKNKIREERKKEAEDRLNGQKEEEVDPKLAAKGKKPDPKAAAPAKGGAKGKVEAVPDGQLIQVSQYAITPAIGSIAPGSAAVISVTFNAQGSKFYNTTLAVDVANRDPNDQPEGIPFQLAAESAIPGINTTDLDQIFEEQTVIPSLDPQLNTQTIISSSLFSIQENVFWFGTLVAGKDPQGSSERFKIINPNKVTCNVKFSVKPRQMSKSEGFAFKIEPESLQIESHKHKYVTVHFNPTEMKQYGGIFEAVVQNGELNPKQGKMTFEIRGEGTLPTLQIQKPDENEPDGTPVLRFRKTRIGKENYMQIILKNDGQVPATARFDAITNESFSFEGTSMNHTVMSKQSHAFDIRFCPRSATTEKFVLTFQTQNNPFECHKVILLGEGYAESVAFENLPNGREDLLFIGDCVIGKAKAVTFQIQNTGDKDIKFRWNSGALDRDEFAFYPSIGHLKGGQSKQIKVMVRGKETKKYDKVDFVCETQTISQKVVEGTKWTDWDDTMKTVKMVRPSEHRKFIRDKEVAEIKRKEEAEAAAFAAQNKKGAKPPAKAATALPEEVVIDMSEEPSVQLIDVIPEPEFDALDGPPKQQILKTSCIIDRASYECTTKQIDFKPTLMYATRSMKFTIKNTSLIGLEYNFKIVNSVSGILDAGPFTIIPKTGTISPGCDENFIVKFSPVEVDPDFTRIFSANIHHLNPNQEPLIIEASGVAQRPIIHFELPVGTYRERKMKDMSFIDDKLKIIEFESLGTNIRNTNRFMAVNPTSSGYEFEWEEIPDETKKKNYFKCATPKGLILSGKKSEMIFEYTPDAVGEHDSRWIFKIPSEKITQEFLVVGRVNEPNVLFESGKMKFGPLLLGGKAKETVRIINQEHIPFAFNFTNASVKGSQDYGDSLKITPMSGVVPAFSDQPIEIMFQPKFELTYNYNLTCNIKRKARPLVLNVKGEGYQIHHTVMADEPLTKVQQNEPFKLDFGEFFINEVKTKQVVLTNNGEFNFDFLWKRQQNKNITITPETGTVQKGGQMKIQIQFLATSETDLKNYKSTLTILSGPKYDFTFVGSARKPGVRLNQHVFDFGQCFVTSQPTPIKKMLTITNIDVQAISVESNFEKKIYLDFPVVPGQVLMPGEEKIEIPITFTPRELRTYHEVVKLNFNNGLYFIDVIVQGVGIPLHLDLKDPDQAFTNLGVVSVGQEVSKSVPLVNRSLKTVKFKVVPRDKKAFTASSLSIHPETVQDIVLKPKESYPVEIRFRPKTRLPPFEQDIMLQIEGIEEPRKFLTVAGVAHGIELKLMDEVAAFGNVVVGSRLTKYIQMSNFGDVKANFSWNKNEFTKNFTINPASGYINPNSNLDLEVTFHPRDDENVGSGKVTCEAKVVCEVKGGEPINLKMMGKPVKQDSSQLQEINFNTVVRTANTQKITIQNPEDKEWAINPTISAKDNSAEYFAGKETFIVPPKSSAQYEIVYLPKTMTKKEKKAEGSEEMVEQPHLGSVFFPLPNGTALLYNLKGTATAPQSEGLIQETVSARKQKNFIVNVKNWAKKTQRFETSFKVDGPNDPSLFIRGANTFDIAGESVKEYKLNFLAMKVGVYKFTATFKEKTSGEYIFYQFAITVEECKDVEKFELVSSVRESSQMAIPIENPTNDDIKVTKQQFQFTNDYLEITPDEIVIKAHETREFMVNYRPLIISEQTTDILFKNPILGDFKYNFTLKGIAPTSQRSLAFKCSLGQDQIQAFKFTHFMKKAVVYQIKVERADGPGVCDFKIEGQPTIPGPAADSYKGVDLQINIKYEPFTIGDSRGILKLTCAEGLEYNCLLYGRSSAPQPQGPIKCPTGAKPVGIDFKNPLNEKVEFLVNFDNSNFSLASKLPGPLEPGKVTNLQIKYDGKAELPSTGRMIVTAKGLPPWIFYLQGE